MVFLLASLLTSFSWATLTASLSSLPLPTPLMTLPPLLRPVLVRLTGLAPPLRVSPLLSKTLLPVVMLPLVPKSILSAKS